MKALHNGINVNLENHLFFENGYQFFKSCNGVMPGQMGYFSSTIVRRETWSDVRFTRKHSEWNYFERLLLMIRNRPCAIMSGIGVYARVGNYRKFSVDSYIWLDSYVNALLYAIELGYCKKLAYKYIKYYLKNQQKSYFGDKVLGKRTISYKSNIKDNLCIDLSYDKTIWYWLSFCPQLLMLPVRFIIKIRNILHN